MALWTKKEQEGLCRKHTAAQESTVYARPVSSFITKSCITMPSVAMLMGNMPVVKLSLARASREKGKLNGKTIKPQYKKYMILTHFQVDGGSC